LILSKLLLQMRFFSPIEPSLKENFMQTKIGTLNALNGLGLAAGYDKEGSLLEALQEIGSGIIEVGTV